MRRLLWFTLSLLDEKGHLNCLVINLTHSHPAFKTSVIKKVLRYNVLKHVFAFYLSLSVSSSFVAFWNLGITSQVGQKNALHATTGKSLIICFSFAWPYLGRLPLDRQIRNLHRLILIRLKHLVRPIL